MAKSSTDYKEYASKHAKKSNTAKDMLYAFLSGGIICSVSQGIKNIYIYFGITPKNSATFVSLTLIFFSTLFTGIGIYDNIAKHTGAGTLVPITGFANAVCAGAIDFKTEGFITGVGTKIFTVAGPVILYGSISSIIYGIIYYAIRLICGV